MKSELMSLVCFRCGRSFYSTFPTQRYCWECRHPVCSYCGKAIDLHKRRLAYAKGIGRILKKNKRFFCSVKHFQLWRKENRASKEELLRRDRERYHQNEEHRKNHLFRNRINPNRTNNEIKINISKFCNRLGINNNLPKEFYKLLYVYYLACKVSGLYGATQQNKHFRYARGWLEREDMYERNNQQRN